MQITDKISPEELSIIHCLAPKFPEQFLSLQELWSLMDKVWDEMGCDNTELDLEKISDYYRHPIWLLNGVFTEYHDVSLQHRHAISDWVSQQYPNKVLDFGGGFGTLARMIADKSPQTTINIYEPYPSKTALERCQSYDRVVFVDQLNGGYDCLISTDVLEHVPEPLDLFAKMIETVRVNGYLVIANHFYPSIKCHLPSTFHLRYSFDKFAIFMGLEVLGPCAGSHATIYQKIKQDSFDWQRIHRMESISKWLFPWREFDRHHLLPWRGRLKRLLVDPEGTFHRIRHKLSRFNN
jgi:SAM-dependent methyltransferase